jgi:hypothetical protein
VGIQATHRWKLNNFHNCRVAGKNNNTVAMTEK